MTAAKSIPTSTTRDTLDANRTTVLRFVEQFKNEGNHDVVDETMTDDFVHHLKDPRLPPGRAGAKLLGQGVAAAFPDVGVEVQDLIVTENKVIERTAAAGTHDGTFAGVPATGRQVKWTETHVYRMEGGKIAEWWPEVDLLAILVQIGAVPAPG